jgi:hypothetical protein
MRKRKEEDTSSDHPDDGEAAKTAMYLVLEHAVEEPAYSVFRIDSAAADGSRRARHLVRILASQHCMSFAAVHSKRGRSWIVGVGGDTTIYYDPAHVDRQFQQGPRPTSAKRDPILISHGHKLYSFSRRYKVDPGAGYDPWFEYLSLGEDGPGSGFWFDLLPPPFPPFVLTPRQYLDPPEICVLAYAAVGSYILLSLEPGGTFAFHVHKVTWAKLDENNLPFVGDAVPLGGNYFASRSKASCGATAVFYIKVFDATSSEPARLSVVEFPAASQSSQDIIPVGGQQLLCPLGLGGGGSFCSVNLMSPHHSSWQPDILKTAQVVVTTCQMNMKEETAELQVLVNDERQIFQFCDLTGFLASPMPLVAVLSMDRRNIEEKPRKKKAAPHILSAPMFTIETSK